MPLNPSGLMALRNGPAMGPQPTAPTSPMGGAPQDPASMIQSAIAQTVNQQRTADHDFNVKTIRQQMRVISVLNVHIQGQYPDVAADLNAAWAKLNAAADKLSKHQSNKTVALGGPLGFSGAGTAPTQNVM